MKFWIKSLFLLLAAITGTISGFNAVDKVPSKCPGIYCGRTADELGNISQCGACPRGYRPDENSLWSRCLRCEATPKLYDWLYLGFMALVALILHWFFIDYHYSKRKKYTMVMIYYAFCLVCMMLVRPLLSTKLANSRGTKSIYAALYFLPTLVLVQAALSGLLYYGFPYLVIVVSVITNAIHFSCFRDQNMKSLLKENLTNPRNLTIILCHWVMHAYGIISITQFTDPSFHGPLLCLVPFPAIFYVITVKFTNPEKLEIA